METDQKNRDYLDFFYDSRKSTSNLIETVLDCSATLVPLWVAVLVGLLVGWMWKPRWVSFLFLGLRSRPRLVWTSSPPGFGGRRFWLALTASVTAFQMLKEFWIKFKAWRWPEHQSHDNHTNQGVSQPQNSSSKQGENITGALLARSMVGEEDLRQLYLKFHKKDGGLRWELLMERSVPGMIYQAWRRDPQAGPTEYMSRTVFENATADMVKDFYWDDEFRFEWDNMIIYSKTLEGCNETGAEIAHWIRKFPFFCSDREYLIGRRIYKCGDIYFCITKGVPYPDIPRKSKPRRVDVYSSSWCVREVASPETGEMTACEVTFLHSEDMGIQRDLAKFGVKQGMWNCVRRMEPGLRKYQALRKLSKPLSHTAEMAQRFTRVPAAFFEGTGSADSGEEATREPEDGKHRSSVKAWKWVIVGGAVALACGLDRGVVGKVLIFGLARRFGRRL